MSRFLSISIIAVLLLSCIDCLAQSNRVDQMTNAMGVNNKTSKSSRADDDERPQTPKITVVKDQGLSLGVDVSPLVMMIVKKGETKGLSFVGRYGLKNKLWANAEAGYENTKYENQNFEYESNGAFIKIGLDYDLFHSEYFPVNDNIFVGFRYGYAWQRHSSDEFVIVDSYWGDYKGSVDKTAVNSHILEALFGLRCEVLPHFYMGWTFRMKVLMASIHNDELEPYRVAGYGSADSRVGMGFTYTLEYQIPFNKLRSRK
ncbi:MAG: DUF6048 family protein [Bacteroidales bacterium]|nr:DUF6048 family protein [Bacteroidales bacterium]